MKVLLGKLNKKCVYLSTMVMALIVLICHVFMLEEKKVGGIKEDEHRDNMRVVSADPITINYYIRIVISGKGNPTVNIYKGDTTQSVDSSISNCIDTSNIKNGVITITNLNIITTANYGIVVSDEIGSGNVTRIDIKMVGTNSITVKGNSDNSYGIYYTDVNSQNSSNTSLIIDGEGSLDINVNNQSGNGYGIYTENDNSLNIEVGNLNIDSSSQGIFAGGGGCTITVPSGGSAEINGTTIDNSETFNSTQLGTLVPSVWPSSYSLKFHVEDDTGTLYAVKSDGTEKNVMSELPNGENGKIEIDGSTLKLTDFQFEAPDGFAKALEITGSGNATIDIDGNNTIESISNTAISVEASVNVEISGSGIFNIIGKKYGINSLGNVTISSGTVNVSVSEVVSAGIRANNLIIGVENGNNNQNPKITVNRESNEIQTNETNVGELDNDGIFSKMTTIHNGQVQVTGNFSNGIQCGTDGKLDINGGDIDVYGRDKGMWVDGDVVINDGDIRCITDESNANSYGVEASGAVSVTGGYAIMQGKKCAISSSSVSYTGTTTEQGKAIMVRASENYNGMPLVEYVPSANNTYDYVEFGVLYSQYLNFNNGTLYKGDSEVAYTPGELTSLNISLDMTDGKKITLAGTTFTTSAKYGLCSDESITLVLADDTTNEIDSAGAADGSTYGAIYVNGILTLEGKGELTLKGNSQAIRANNVTFTKGTDGELAVQEASTAYGATNIETYPNMNNWTGYRYVKIGLLEDYYFKYDATNGEMYSVYVKADGSERTQKKLNSPNELKSGWSIISDGEGGHILELNDFNLTTRAPYGIRIIGDGVVKLINSNVITTTDNKYSHYVGLLAEGNIIMNGAGSIETIRGNNAANNVGIKSDGNMTINGGTYTVENVATGIQCSGDLTITNSTCNLLTNISTAIKCGGNLTITNSNCELLADINGIEMTSAKKITIKESDLEITGKAKAVELKANSESDIYESVWASTAENEDEITEISDINTRVRNSGTGNNNLSTFKYVKMDIPVFSVDITWGALEYTCKGHWNPNTHVYEEEWIVDTDNHADMIRVENGVDSNASVKATISHNIDEEGKGIGATFVTDRRLEDQLAKDTNSVEDVLDKATGLLERYLVLSKLPNQNYDTPTSVGSVTVTLEDNID